MRKLAIGVALMFVGNIPLGAGVPTKYQPAVAEGLEWLAKQQHKDGHWPAEKGVASELHTALASLAMMQEGSTVGQGKYARPLTLAADWLMKRRRDDGLLGAAKSDEETARALLGHGIVLRLLAETYGEEENRDRRVELKKAINLAVQFCVRKQNSHGGWSVKKDRTDLDVTIAMLHGLRAARDAGIPVPRDVMKKGSACLQNATTAKGGVVPKLNEDGKAMGDESATLTAGALVCLFSDGEFRDEHSKKWLRYCQGVHAQGKEGDPWFHFYFAPVVWRLGEDGYARMLPQAPAADRLTWSAFRTVVFDQLQKSQRADGSWHDVRRDSGLVTAINLLVMQQDNQPLATTPR